MPTQPAPGYVPPYLRGRPTGNVWGNSPPPPAPDPGAPAADAAPPSPAATPEQGGVVFGADGRPIQLPSGGSGQQAYVRVGNRYTFAPGSNPGSGGGGGQGGQNYTGVPDPNPEFGNWREFSDSAYEEMARALDPQFQQAENDFRQRMVNQGIAEGSEAYDNAYANFTRTRNDAYDQARRSSIDVGQRAQAQAFGQNAQEAALDLQEELGRLGMDTQINLANLSNLNNSQRLGLDREMFQEDTRRYDQGFGEDTRRWDLSRGDSLSQQDFNNLLSAMGFDFGVNQYNNDLINQDFQRGLPFMGLIPNGGPAGIDVTGSYGLGYNADSQRAASNQREEEAQNAAYMAALGYFLSDRNAKEAIEPFDPATAVDAVLRLPIVTFQYVGNPQPHVGTFAQDFHREFGLPESRTISFTDAFGAMFAAVKGLAEQNRALRAEVQQLREAQA